MSRASRSHHLFLGTSGWVYLDWLGTVYPPGMKKSGETFPHYAKVFRSVELNSTFYHFPRETTVTNWQAMGGRDFVWAVKAWRRLTHIKRLHNVRKDLNEFLRRVEPLVASHGVVLFQLPPSFRQDLGRLERFLKRLPDFVRTAFEFRHTSWFAKDTYALLKDYRVALVGVDAPGIPRVLDVRTAPFAYFRFHGSSAWYRHDYSSQELEAFAAAALAHLNVGDLYTYFDNTADGAAFRNAIQFRKLVTG